MCVCLEIISREANINRVYQSEERQGSEIVTPILGGGVLRHAPPEKKESDI